MTGSRTCHRPAIAACLLAASLLASGRLLAADGNRLAWAPSREDAVVIDGFPVSAMPQESALSKSVASRRPPGLSRPAPARSQTFIASAPAGESLPSVSGIPLSPEGLPVPPEMYYDESGSVIHGEMPGGAAGCSPCGLVRCGTGTCTWVPLCLFLPLPPLDGLEIHHGAQGYTGPANRGGSGSFGMHEGFNWGLPLCGFMGGQWGANWTQSNFDGNYLTEDTRHQVFATAGLYRRVDWGFQGGLVFDYLRDDWDYQADLGQLRGELSWLWCGCNEIGFWFAAGVNDSENLLIRRPVATSTDDIIFTSSRATLEVHDMYALFFRRQFPTGGQGRMFAGLTGNGQGLIGGESQLPINPRWSLRTSFLYVEPGDSDSASDPRFTRESWNVGISLVWTPCPRDPCSRGYGRPLFNVADNGTFITRLIGQ